MDRIRSTEYFRETEHVRCLGNKASPRWFGRGQRKDGEYGRREAWRRSWEKIYGRRERKHEVSWCEREKDAEDGVRRRQIKQLRPRQKGTAQRKRKLSRANYKLSFDRKSPQAPGEVCPTAPLTFPSPFNRFKTTSSVFVEKQIAVTCVASAEGI